LSSNHLYRTATHLFQNTNLRVIHHMLNIYNQTLFNVITLHMKFKCQHIFSSHIHVNTIIKFHTKYGIDSLANSNGENIYEYAYLPQAMRGGLIM
jgi:hypothetical protein